ncbi:MAG: tyrosine-type recombinase/integrase [Streptosporangiaceae bacterium]|nr:tyrosine-type recombinase/integrase [Streptosporangiaceae bacterium]MBV9853830.1 tyrosine-type recombinase/integrase [Streptosporangiaceae bacterium]
MTQAPAAIFKIPTESPQPARKAARPARRAKAGRPAPGRVLANGTGRTATRGGGEVIELDYGITVYPDREEKGRWRAVWYEDGKRQQCEAGTEQKLAAKLEKVTERLEADAPNMKLPGAALIAHYLDPDRLPVDERWSRRHADTQRRLCERFAAPVIDAVTCQDIKTGHTQKIVNAAPTPGEGNRVHRMISALVSVGLEGGYLANPRLARVHWQAGDRELPAPRVTVAGESALWVDPAEIPAGSDIGKLGRALAAGRHGERDELMASTAAYSGLRWGELAALTIPQVDQADRVITVDRKVVEVAGHLYVEAPKCRKYRRTIYPRRTPDGYPLAERLAARIEEARGEQQAGTNPLGLIFPSPKGKHWRSSNFNRGVLQRAYLAIGWRDAEGNGRWTWHSLRHVFCTTALFVWKLDPTDVSRMAGHANYRITLDMYVGSTAGVLDRARQATD